MAPDPSPTAVKVLVISKNDVLSKEVDTVFESDKEFHLQDASYLEDGVVQAVKSLLPDIVLYDYQYSAPDEIFDTIDDITILHPDVSIIVIIPEEEIANANRVILAGARAFIPYPFSHVNLLSTMKRVRELHSRITGPGSQPGQGKDPFRPDRSFLIFSPKGGVGCSTVAANLAIALYQECGEEVLLVDGKHLFGDIGLMLNIKTANSIIDLIPHVASLDETLVRQIVIRHTSGIQVLPSPFSASVAQSIRPDDLFSVIQGLQHIFPNMVIDGGNYLNDEVVTLMDSCQKVILVLNADLASLRNARLFLDICRTLSYPREKILLLMNKVSGKNDVALNEVEKVLRTKIFGVIPSDDNLALAALNEGVPMIIKRANHPIAKAYHKIANNLLDLAAPTGPRVHTEVSSDVLLRTSRLG
ncbi:MAG: cellulose synthase operon protein YhjQ/BcsQ [Anaerolineaceae bacterium]